MTKNKNYLPLIARIIAGVMLLLAMADWQYSYYEVLRVVVCIASLYLAYDLYENKRVGWTCIFVATAILFNPLIPIYMQKETWQLIDFVSAIIFFASLSLKDRVVRNEE